MVAPVLTPEQREAAASLFMDYIIANDRGFIVAMTISRGMADEIASKSPHWYSVYHLSDLPSPLTPQVAA
jgi:hypothetical protein